MAIAEKTTWSIDPTHSEVMFKVKHLVISTVTGKFKSFEGTAETSGDNFNDASVSFSIDTNSIDTNQSDRDNHLKSADFFDAAQFPKITFTGKVSGDKLVGDLTLHGVTKNVSLDVDFGGVVQDPYGNTKAGFELRGKINRKDFGLNWSAVTEAGGIVVSDDVKMEISVQVVKG